MRSLFLAAALSFIGCSSGATSPAPAPGGTSDAGAATPSGVVVVLETSKGRIEVQLDAEHAPNTVANFLRYVDDKHYDGTIFHRVIPSFMIQGGGYTRNYEEKATRAPIAIEADNGLKNVRGAIAMARTSDPNSASSQFFIDVVDNNSLDFKSKTNSGWGYTVFGAVISGIDVADAIVSVPTGAAGSFASDVPVETIEIRAAHRR